VKILVKRRNKCNSVSVRYHVECILPVGHPGSHRSATMHSHSIGRGYFTWYDATENETWNALYENPDPAT
jgi:hypothetical protein